MKPLKEKVSITLDEDVVKRIRELAEEDDLFSRYQQSFERACLATEKELKPLK